MWQLKYQSVDYKTTSNKSEVRGEMAAALSPGLWLKPYILLCIQGHFSKSKCACNTELYSRLFRNIIIDNVWMWVFRVGVWVICNYSGLANCKVPFVQTRWGYGT